MIKTRLVEATGWVELRIMCNTECKDCQTASAWVQKTLCRGKEILETHRHFLADRAYVGKALDYMMPSEIDIMEKTLY